MSAHTANAAPLSASIGSGIISTTGVIDSPKMRIPFSKEATGSMRETEIITRDIPMTLSCSGLVDVPDEQSDVLIVSFCSVL